MRALSSAGSEHLVYTQRVGGPNPSAPRDFPFLLFKVDQILLIISALKQIQLFHPIGSFVVCYDISHFITNIQLIAFVGKQVKEFFCFR